MDTIISKNNIRIPFIIAVFIVTHTGCSVLETSSSNRLPSPSANGIENSFNPAGQLTLSENMYSIRLYSTNSPNSAPIIQLHSDQQLQLDFETLGLDSRQFRVRFTHHNPDWSNSGLPPEYFLDGFQSVYINGGETSRQTRPSYLRFSLRFPNQDFSFTFSGNYMLHVEDADNGNLLFTLPFFIYENEGSITSSVDERTTPRQNLRRFDFPVSRYALPESVDQPQFDLEFYYTQNRFWGRSKQANELDFSAPDHVQFEMRTDDGFIGDYEFNGLNFTSISQLSPGVSEIDTDPEIPIVILEDDSEGFSNQQPVNSSGRTGPSTSMRGEYAQVIFRFDHQQTLSENSGIYLVGDFNQWAIQSQNRLTLNEEINRWETSAVFKTGNYRYKYVVLENNKVDDLIFDRQFSSDRQEYHAMVYKKDWDTQTFRLLQVNPFYSGY